MDVGLNTQNLAAILLVVVLSIINVFGVKTGALIQNIFTIAKVSALLGLVIFGVLLGRNAQALAANFGANFWRGASLGTLHDVGAGCWFRRLPCWRLRKWDRCSRPMPGTT